MFSHVPSLLALIPMLLHGILGCCWHHAHECRGEVDGSRVVCQAGVDSSEGKHGVADRDVHESCPSHRHAVEVGGTDEPSDDPCRRVPCNEERCSFVGTVVLVSQVGFDLELSWACTVFIACEQLVPHAGQFAIPRVFEENAFPHSDAERRALTQVWLI